MTARVLPPMPRQIAALPTHRGYPVPWFVQDVDGQPDFRVVDNMKVIRAIQEKRCFVCGEPLGGICAFISGPLGVINGVSSEPPVHPACAEWSVQACPFLVRPDMRRRPQGLPEGATANPGLVLDNPEVSFVWECGGYSVSVQDDALFLFPGERIQPITAWARGKRVTPEKAAESLIKGYARLLSECADYAQARELTQKLAVAVGRCDLISQREHIGREIERLTKAQRGVRL